MDVRHAIFLGINREVLATAALGTLGWEPRVLNNRFLMPEQPGYADNSGEWGKYDPDRAAQLLEEAGWTAAQPGEVRTRDGKPLTLRFIVPQGYAPAWEEAELVQSMLAEIGVDIKITSVPGNQLFSKYVQPGNYDLVAFVNSGRGSRSGLAAPVARRGDGADGKPQWRTNVGRIGSRGGPGPVRRARGLDRGTAIEQLNKADRLLWELGHTLPLYQRPRSTRSATPGQCGAPGWARWTTPTSATWCRTAGAPHRGRAGWGRRGDAAECYGIRS